MTPQVLQRDATHPAMYSYFDIERNSLSAYDDFNMTQSGLLLIDTSNRTVRDLFFQKWADCARNTDCISPHSAYSGLSSKKQYFNGSVYR